MKRKIAVWGFLAAGILWAVSGVRDIIAPGFFNISPRLPQRSDIIIEFAAAAAFLVLAAFANRGGFERALHKK